VEITCCAARLSDEVYVIAEDWGSHAFSREAAKLAANILKPGSGYAGSRDLDKVADFVAGLLEIPADKPYGCCLMLARVIDRMPSS
jgi:hypothetical protein